MAAVSEATGTSWVVLTGLFGSGKTTSALSVATRSSSRAVFLPCQSIRTEVFKSGATNGLMQHVVDWLDLLDDLEDSDRSQLCRLAASVLSYLLRQPSSPYLLVLDGLDEHHYLTTLEGLQRLSNQLAEFSCPVILTTRREHLESMSGDFGIALSELGKKFGATREAVVLCLEQWTLNESQAVTEHAVRATSGDQRSNLENFLRELASHGSKGSYGDLVLHPLFLQFILEDVAERGMHTTPRHQLIRRWVERKLRRDRESAVPGAVEPRSAIAPAMDTDEVIERVLQGMSLVAAEMTVHIGSDRHLSEGLPSTRVQELISTAFGGLGVDLLPILLHSVLTTLGPRKGGAVQVGFALRILHEYFAAAHLVAAGEDLSGWPMSIRGLALEMQEAPIV